MLPLAPDPFDYESALEACARGEQFALEALYARESRWLMGVVLRIVRNHDIAQEVLQEAFVLVWQRAGRYQRALGSGRGWIYTVVRHRALDEARRSGPEIAVGDDLEMLADLAQARDAGRCRRGRRPRALPGDARRAQADLRDRGVRRRSHARGDRGPAGRAPGQRPRPGSAAACWP